MCVGVSVNTIAGSILFSQAVAIVCPCNTQGVTPGGLPRALEYRYPRANAVYQRAGQEGRLRAGEVLPVLGREDGAPRLIVYLPTQELPGDFAQRTDIELGLVAMRAALEERRVPSVAIPALGCGLGGLPWTLVSSIVSGVMGDSAVATELYEPRAVRLRARPW